MILLAWPVPSHLVVFSGSLTDWVHAREVGTKSPQCHHEVPFPQVDCPPCPAPLYSLVSGSLRDNVMSPCPPSPALPTRLLSQAWDGSPPWNYTEHPHQPPGQSLASYSSLIPPFSCEWSPELTLAAWAQKSPSSPLQLLGALSWAARPHPSSNIVKQLTTPDPAQTGWNWTSTTY